MQVRSNTSAEHIDPGSDAAELGEWCGEKKRKHLKVRANYLQEKAKAGSTDPDPEIEEG